MKFKVGDKVRVRKDLEIDETYGENIFVEEMKYLWGEVVTISKVCEAGQYRLVEDETGCCWTDEMLEAVNEEAEEIDKPSTMLAKVVKHWDASGVKPEPEETPQAPFGFHTGEKLFFGLDDINHRLIRELKHYADAGVISPEDHEKQVAYLAMEKALNNPNESNSRIYTTVTDSVNHPAHYNVGGIETIDVIRAMLTPEEYRGYLKGNVLEYRERAPYKHETPEEYHAKAKVYWELLQEAEGERIFE